MTATPEALTPTLVDVPGARVAYYVRPAEPGSPEAPPLLLVGSPMDHTGFDTLSSYFTDRTVITLDPRNTGQSEPEDPTAGVSAAQHADDLRAVLDHVGAGTVDVFASSGGALNMVWLVAAGGARVRTLVAHEPPIGGLLSDAAAVQTVCDDIVTTYDAHGLGPAIAQFMAVIMHRGEFGQEFMVQPAPDPAMFGLPGEDDGSRDDPLVANLRGRATTMLPDLDAVVGSPTRVVVGVGEESGGPTDGEMAVRSAWALADRLGVEATVFPSGHGGFAGGEFGQQGKPEEFAARLREVLA